MSLFVFMYFTIVVLLFLSIKKIKLKLLLLEFCFAYWCFNGLLTFDYSSGDWSDRTKMSPGCVGPTSKSKAHCTSRYAALARTGSDSNCSTHVDSQEPPLGTKHEVGINNNFRQFDY